ncbi:MAG: HAMP domain-containing protein [SAR324 cluster bacterium]|nr:HAMP domain-containing protein [SAR324 cluster bacterium]
MVSGLGEYGRGNLDSRVEVKSKDEVRWLANAFNDMVAVTA